MRLELHLTLLSDATFGRGEGLAGLVDEEVEHDTATGLPFVRGRTLKGLLVEECANLLYALSRIDEAVAEHFEHAAHVLFGQPGSLAADTGVLHVGPALLPADLRDAVARDIERGTLDPALVLEALTAIRHQTAVDDVTAAPVEGSLRSMRVVLRGTMFASDLSYEVAPDVGVPDADLLALLAACTVGLRRGGTGRNRGRGRLTATLHVGDTDVTSTYYAPLRTALLSRGAA